jgi:hypothetical protein
MIDPIALITVPMATPGSPISNVRGILVPRFTITENTATIIGFKVSPNA